MESHNSKWHYPVPQPSETVTPRERGRQLSEQLCPFHKDGPCRGNAKGNGRPASQLGLYTPSDWPSQAKSQMLRSRRKRQRRPVRNGSSGESPEKTGDLSAIRPDTNRLKVDKKSSSTAADKGFLRSSQRLVRSCQGSVVHSRFKIALAD